jgi:hypothetical protein
MQWMQPPINRAVHVLALICYMYYKIESFSSVEILFKANCGQCDKYYEHLVKWDRIVQSVKWLAEMKGVLILADSAIFIFIALSRPVLGPA